MDVLLLTEINKTIRKDGTELNDCFVYQTQAGPQFEGVFIDYV